MFFWQTLPVLDEVDALKIKRDSFNEALSYSKELTILKNRLIDDFSSISSADIEKILKICPPEADIPRLVLQISEIAKKNDVSMENIDAVEKQTIPGSLAAMGQGGCREIELTISFPATYEKFSVFLENLEKSLRLIDVKNIEIFSSEGLIYNFNIKAVAYSQ